MKTVKLSVTEKLEYRRELIVKIPDAMTDRELEKVLSKAERNNEMLSDFIYDLEHAGVEVDHSYDDDLHSPFGGEVECEEYDYVKGDE